MSISKNHIQRLARTHIDILKTDNPTNKARLANFRKMKAQEVSELPELWERLYAIPFPEDITRSEEQRLENALMGVFLIFAQESHLVKNPTTEYDYSSGVGKSLRSIGAERNNLEHKFSALVNTKTYFDTLRKLLNLLKLASARQPLDYGNLAWEFYALQNPSARQKIFLSWGKEFYSIPHNSTDKPSQ